MALRQPTSARANCALRRETRDRPHIDPRVHSEAIPESADHIFQSPNGSQPQRVLGPSVLSDFGSLNTVPRSSTKEDELHHNIEDAIDELDSLDEGLHAFREPSFQQLSQRSDQSVGAILPVHDGLGTFSPLRTPLNNRAQSPNSSIPRLFHEAQLEASPRLFMSPRSAVKQQSGEQWRLQDTTFERVERWRLEQSSYMPGDMESEDRRVDEFRFSKKTKSLRGRRKRSAQSSQTSDRDALWQRLADKLLRQLIGIDDPTLFIIFGEYLPEKTGVDFHPSKASTELSCEEGAQNSTENRQSRLLRRLKEKLSEQLGLNIPDMPKLDPLDLDYAGIPINWISNRRRDENLLISDDIHKDCLNFPPTLGAQKPKPPSEMSNAVEIPGPTGSDQDSPTTEKDCHWTQGTGLRNVLRFLCRRFLIHGASLQENNRSNIATSCSPETIRRAAVIQQHHPLVSAPKRSKASLNQSSRIRLCPGRSNPVVPGRSLKRRSSGYLSLSTKRSCRPTTDRVSRNYWDMGESMVTSSAIFAGIGAWGEL